MVKKPLEPPGPNITQDVMVRESTPTNKVKSKIGMKMKSVSINPVKIEQVKIKTVKVK
jgi:hypothetical protein